MEEEGVPSTALREVSLLQMLSQSNHVVKLLSVEHIEEAGKPMLYLVRLLGALTRSSCFLSCQEACFSSPRALALTSSSPFSLLPVPPSTRCLST